VIIMMMIMIMPLAVIIRDHQMFKFDPALITGTEIGRRRGRRGGRSRR
jgi:hypothetical protein